MLVVLSYCPKDLDQAERLADWILELGGAKGHKLLLLRDTTLENDRVAATLAKSFDAVEVQPFVDLWNAWPFSPNACFAQAARHIEATYPQPFLWIEPDVCPMQPGWIDSLWQEYQRAKKPFLGDYVDVADVPPHCSGIAIYPGRMTQYAGSALIAGDVAAWDVCCAHQVVPQMHRSAQISHAWKFPGFDNWEHVERELLAFKPKCVLRHADKSGSLIRLLRERMNLPVPVLAEANRKAGSEARESTTQTEVKSTDSRGGQSLSGPVRDRTPQNMAAAGPGTSFDILIKTYPADSERLGYCLRSIVKFATGFRKLVIVVPSGVGLPLPLWESVRDKGIELAVCPTVEAGDGYLFQQAIKASGHEWTGADYILHVDSDCLFNQPVTPQTFMRDGKPIWYMTPYAQTDTPWQPITEKFLGEPVDYEFMRRLPILVPRSLHLAISAFAMANHGTRLTDYILSQPNRAFSEFNALGALAYSRARADFHWIDTTREEIPPAVVLQSWSHSELTEEVKAEFEAILKGGAPCAANAKPDTNPGARQSEMQQSSAAPKSDPDSAANLILTGENNDTTRSNRNHIRSSRGDILHDGSDNPVLGGVNPRIKQTPAGHWVLVEDTAISRWIEQHGSLQHDFHTLPKVLEEIQPGDVVVDAGACVGDTCGPFLERVGQKGHVIAFEPHPDAYECLKLNCPTASVFQVALSDNQDGAGMMFDPNAGASYLKDVGETFVRTMTLDSMELDRLSFLKIDVEGMELSVLRGAEQTIARFHPKLLIEVNQGALERQGTNVAELSRWLCERGYDWKIVQGASFVGSPQYDILCTYVGAPATPEKLPAETPLDFAPMIPWQDKEATVLRAHVIAAELKLFCTSPRYTARVRDILRQEKVIK